MQEEFVPYDIALAMKELGFDEPCLFRYTAQKDLTNGGCYDNSSPSDAMLTADEIHESHILAPLYQQAFRWFREKCNIDCRFHTYNHFKEGVRTDFMWDYIDGKKTSFDGYEKTYQEAQDACLRRLIEIVKEKQDGHN